MNTAICLIAACLIAEESATRCDREPGSMVIIERPITWRDTADLPAGFTSREQRACERIAHELMEKAPPNYRLVSHQVERRRVQEAGVR